MKLLHHGAQSRAQRNGEQDEETAYKTFPSVDGICEGPYTPYLDHSLLSPPQRRRLTRLLRGPPDFVQTRWPAPNTDRSPRFLAALYPVFP
jgi:hypothetical protein